MEPIKFEDILDMIRSGKAYGAEFLTRENLADDFDIAVVKNGTLVWKNSTSFIDQVSINTKTINDQWFIRRPKKELYLSNAVKEFGNGYKVKIVETDGHISHLKDIIFYTDKGTKIYFDELVKCKFYKVEK